MSTSVYWNPPKFFPTEIFYDYASTYLKIQKDNPFYSKGVKILGRVVTNPLIMAAGLIDFLAREVIYFTCLSSGKIDPCYSNTIYWGFWRVTPLATVGHAFYAIFFGFQR